MTKCIDLATQSPTTALAARTPLQIIEALGLASRIDPAAITSRQSALTMIQMATQDFPIGDLLDVITSDVALCPPRTGHVGNWGNIADGRAGAMDFNKAICAPGYGYPLIYGFTQTETDEPRQGDWGYLPGSLIDGDVRTLLPLHAWDGTEFAPCTRERALFTPFVQAELAGGLHALSDVHRQRMHAHQQFRFQFEQALIARHEQLVRPLLTVLIEEARHRENSRRALQDLISHAAALDGTVTRSDLVVDGKGFKLVDCYYPSAEALVEHAMFPFRAVAHPRAFMDAIGCLPWRLPVVSNTVISVLSAILGTHYSSVEALRRASTGPLNPHLHWGGRDMAGYPPRRKGYLLEDAKVRSMKRICTTLVGTFSEIPPISFVLLPATVFMLCPTSVHPGDAELLTTLFRKVRELPLAKANASGTEALQNAIEDAARSWHDVNAGKLSPYFIERFGPRRGGMPSVGLPCFSDPVEPEGFRELTFRQASMIVGALFEIGAARTSP